MRVSILMMPLLAAAGSPILAQDAAVLAAEAASITPQIIAVEFVPVREQPLIADIQLTGTISARDSINMSFPSGGRITEILVEAGDHVAKGQPLARTDGVQQQQALNRAEAGVAAAEAAERQARQAADRAAEMLRRGVGTRAAHDTAQQSLSAAEGQLESARNAAAWVAPRMFSVSISSGQAWPTPWPRHHRWMRGTMPCRAAGASSLESLTPCGALRQVSSMATTPTLTGPASAPRPTSSIPTSTG